MHVAIVAPPGVQSLDVVGPAEVFWEAARRLGRPDAYRVSVVGVSREPIRGTGALCFLPDRSIEDPDEPIDTLLVGGDPRLTDPDPKLTAWLARCAPNCRRFGSICTGAFLLAEAGLLDGRTVTTHWECAEQLSSRYPALTVEADRIFVREGPLCTAAGVSAGMDLALALVEEDHGRELAIAVARYMVMFLKRPGGQSQFSSHLAAQVTRPSPIQKVQEYVLAHLSERLSVPALARMASMSQRNFTRIFGREAGMTPGDFVEAARIDAARRMLEDTPISLQRVAYGCGFGNVDGMRRAFVRTLGVGPSDYRKRFRSAWAEPGDGGVSPRQPPEPAAHNKAA
jgi:transcriptional regulator GlxA family with amidase domain